MAVNDQRYIWEESNPIPSVSNEGFTHPATILSFLDLEPGDELSLEQLERRVEQARIRLEESNLFYLVELNLVPSRVNQGHITLVIRLTEGFRQRYNGGPFWAYWGLDNLHGRGDSLGIWAGWNRNQLEYLRHLSPGGPLSIGLKGGYLASPFYDDQEYQQVFGALSLDYGLTSSSSISLEYWYHYPLITNGFISDQSRISTSLTSAWLFTEAQNSSLSMRIGLSESLTLQEQSSASLEFRALLHLGQAIGQVKVHSMLADPFLDPFFNKPLIQGYLRSAHGEGHQRSHHFGGYSVEFPLPLEFDHINLYPYVYWDQLWLDYQERAEGLGVGMHLFIPAPVLLDLNLWGGMNLNGETLVHIEVSLGNPYPIFYDFER